MSWVDPLDDWLFLFTFPDIVHWLKAAEKSDDNKNVPANTKHNMKHNIQLVHKLQNWPQ